MGNRLSGVKPGHLNMGRALRSLEHKTGSVRRLSFELPEMFAKDSYGVETSTLKLPKINIPSMLANVQPVTTRNFQLAKEGRYITGAAKIYLPNMESIFASTVYTALTGDNTNDISPYQWGVLPDGNSTATIKYNNFFRGFDGLMDGVFYDEDAEIWSSQWGINESGKQNWNSTSDFSSLLGSDFTPFSSGTTLTSDNESVTISVSGQRNNTGTVLWLPNDSPASFLADRVSFDVQFGSDDGNEKTVPSNDGQGLDFFIMEGASTYSYVRYKMDMATGFQFNAGMFLRFDFPFTSGSLGTFFNNAKPINPWFNRNHSEGVDDQPAGTYYQPNNSVSKITMTQTPTTGSLNSASDGVYKGWTKTIANGGLILAWRFKGNSSSSSPFTQIKIKNIRFYRSLPWSIHSVKERKNDFVVLNCVRTDGDSMHRQEVYGEQVPEL